MATRSGRRVHVVLGGSSRVGAGLLGLAVLTAPAAAQTVSYLTPPSTPAAPRASVPPFSGFKLAMPALPRFGAVGPTFAKPGRAVAKPKPGAGLPDLHAAREPARGGTATKSTVEVARTVGAATATPEPSRILNGLPFADEAPVKSPEVFTPAPRKASASKSRAAPREAFPTIAPFGTGPVRGPQFGLFALEEDNARFDANAYRRQGPVY